MKKGFRFTRLLTIFVALAALAACGGPRGGDIDTQPVYPLDQRLAGFAAAHNSRDVDGLMAYFTEGAVVRSPAMPHPGYPPHYSRAYLAEPFRMEISQTEILFSNRMGAKTRSRVKLSAPGKYSLEDVMETRWAFEQGQWKIAELEYPAWPQIMGTWKKSGLRGETSIELRLMPGGKYVVYAERDRTLPTFRGTYRIEGNMVYLTDSSAADSGNFSSEEGRYVVTFSGPSANFRKVEDGNRWRSERYEGLWTAAR